MERSIAILLVLAVYLVAMLAIGWSSRRSAGTASSFYLGGRQLGPWVAALAANASSSSAWSLVGVSGFAYLHGKAALWLIPGCVGGFLLNWFVVAPRLRSATGGAITLTELLAGPSGPPFRRSFLVFASVLTLASLLTYIAAQMQAAGAAFVYTFEVPLWQGVLVGAVLTVLYTLLGGYLAASRTDMVQGLMMVAVAVLVPVVGVVSIGGVGALLDALDAVAGTFNDPFGGRQGASAVAFALGLCGIGLGYPGQPHAVNKYMGMSPTASMRTARVVGISWALLLYPGMIVLGWLVRVQWPLAAGAHEDALFVASQNLLPPWLDGLVLAAVLAAIMSTVDGQLLVCASTVTHDLRRDDRAGRPRHRAGHRCGRDNRRDAGTEEHLRPRPLCLGSTGVGVWTTASCPPVPRAASPRLGTGQCHDWWPWCHRRLLRAGAQRRLRRPGAIVGTRVRRRVARREPIARTTPSQVMQRAGAS